MNYEQFLEQVINDGIEGAKRDYKRENQKLLREGSISGFESCRGKSIVELSKLLEESQKESHKKSMERAENYWYYLGFALEVEWVCNVVSAMLMNQGQPTIINPTARGMIRVANIIGIK